MSLSSGKASGKPTSYTPCTKGLVWHAEHDERIAELEAELAKMKKGLEVYLRAKSEEHDRAEKAEAEVERLTALCLRYQVNPYEGGGRETARKERDEG